MEDFIKIKVGKHTIGIVGLKTVLAEIVAQDRDVARFCGNFLFFEFLDHQKILFRPAE